MDRRILKALVLAGLIGSVVGRLPLALGSSQFEVSASPEDISVEVGESFSVNVSVANVPPPGVYAYQLGLYYDSSVLQAVSAQIPSDNFLKPTNPSNIFIVDPGTINQSAGYVTFALTLLGNEPEHIGSGVLATVQFTALAAGLSLLEVKESDFILLDSNGNRIPASQYQLRHGSVNVSSGLAGMWVFLSPQNKSVSVGQSFSISINIVNVPSPGLLSYGLSLYYNSSVLQAVSAQIPSDNFLKPTNPSNIFIVDPGTINQSAGYVTFALTLLGNETSKTGSGVLATVQFASLTIGMSLLEIRDALFAGFSWDQYSLGQGSVEVVQLISVADYTVSFDENVTVEVLVEPASTVIGGSFDICFDESFVNAVSLSPGDFGEPAYVIDNHAGLVEVTTEGAATTGKDVAVLARVTFRGIGGGFTILQLQKARLKDEEGNTFAPVARSGSIDVSGPLMEIPPRSVEVGSTVNVSILVYNAEYIAGGSMNLIFDSLVIEAVSVFPGDFGMPTADIGENGSVVSLIFSLTSAVGKPNATLAIISFVGIGEGVTYFRVEDAELHDVQGNSVSPGFLNPHGWYWRVVVIPEFQPIGILLVCLLLGSIVVVIKKKLLSTRAAANMSIDRHTAPVCTGRSTQAL